MTYAELIEYFLQKSGLTIKDFAGRTSHSVGQISLILNGHQKGSIKILEDCAEAVEEDLETYLWVPEKAESVEERKALRLFKQLNAKRQQLALDVLQSFADAEEKKK